ncbi:phage baseplate assembly protein GpW [Abyssogena phaseoliformis symbiont OG214]|uniref:hypothetical protein n=1 Tax=Abyssogena phaseoliformis symbiont TaxID=596095 RepID=UPI0019154839|nr:hypothetical protein [Abyssogena phaseoliformis symbiont]MBW5288812.1 hypothetical protein [Candidatus Ruthia sp. Apha_13_S6]BBB22282.1 baseplate assembly protein GpW [Abyssogena phaseoliformis symbiont OG214]BBB23220.1 phage baseplate assembly protein GpW [Abyssogena phaseoliformis symbiont OG214]
MQRLNRQTGQTIAGVDWLEQQIADILTTSKTTRTMRAEYSSNLIDFLDRNIDEDFGVEIVTEVNSALSVLSDVFRLTSVNMLQTGEKIQLEIIGKYLETGEEIKLNSVFVA